MPNYALPSPLPFAADDRFCRLRLLGILLGITLTCSGQADAPLSKNMEVASPNATATYVRRDGSISIVGNDGMEAILNKFNALFTQQHPGVKFAMLLKGSSTGIGGLTSGVSAFAPMGREAWPSELAGFREAYGYMPLDIHVGYGGFTRAGHKNPPGIYVNAKNPLPGLSVEQVAQIFTEGSSAGDITFWSQLNLKGDWAKRAIHLYGPPDDGGLASSLRTIMMEKRAFRPNYEELPKLADVVAAVAIDPYGIALVGFYDPGAAAKARLVPLRVSERVGYSLPSLENVRAGRYPYVPFLHFYLNRAPGKPVDPLITDYIKLVLSSEGQAIIAEQQEGDDAYVPLDPKAIAGELMKLQ